MYALGVETDSLKIPNGTPASSEMFPNIKPKCEDEIDDDGRAKGEEGKVNKVLSYAATSNAKFLAYLGTYPKNGKFQDVLKSFHYPKHFCKNRNLEIENRRTGVQITWVDLYN